MTEKLALLSAVNTFDDMIDECISTYCMDSNDPYIIELKEAQQVIKGMLKKYNISNFLPIDSEEKEECLLCHLGLVYYPYMTPNARNLYDSITPEQWREIDEKIRRK